MGPRSQIRVSSAALAASSPLACGEEHRTGFINGFQGLVSGPQGLTPAFLAAASGTTEVVPFPKPLMRPVPG
jgi:hypothetical protein